MANPQVENGFTKIANEVMEALAKHRLSGQERQIVDVVLRKTYGFNKKEDVISMGQFSKFTGINRPCVARLLKSLLSKKILSVTQKDNTNGNTYIFQKDFEQWRVLSKKITVIKKDNKSVINTAQKVLSKMIHTKETLTKNKIHIYIPVIKKDNTPVYTVEFLSFYEGYPRKEAKPDAYKAWSKLSPSNGVVKAIMAGLEAWKKNPNWLKDNGQYIPLPASWLNKRRWEDEITTSKGEQLADKYKPL